MDVGRDRASRAIVDFGIEAHEPLPELKSRLDRVAPVFLEHVRAVVDEGRLDETFVHAQSNPPKVYTYGGLIAHVLTFAAHRRTLVAGALASAGVTDLGNGDPREWVAQAQ
jgi:AraC family transcriptional regulator